MQTPRESFIKALTFQRPERVPLMTGGPRESTLRAWARQGMDPNRNFWAQVLEALGIEMTETRPVPSLDVTFKILPQFEEKVLEHKDGHYVVQDWMGNITEISDAFDVTYIRSAKDFVTRKWHRFPVVGRDSFEAMKGRYRLDAPGRFPEDFFQRCEQLAGRETPLTVSVNGPFWQMREWVGFEPLCMLFLDDPEFIDEMVSFWSDFVAAMLDKISARVTLDSLHISEDMAYKAHSMISPAMTRKHLQSCYVRWSEIVRGAGTPIVDMDSDGCIEELIPIWIESGINVCDPIEVAAHNDIVEFRRRFGTRMAYKGGVDKRAMAAGGERLRDEIARIAPVVRDGGYIPGCDHGVPPDVSWANYIECTKLLAELCGWL